MLYHDTGKDKLMITNFSQKKEWPNPQKPDWAWYEMYYFFYSASADQNYFAILDPQTMEIHIVDTNSLETKKIISPVFELTAETPFMPVFALSADGSRLAIITSFYDTATREVIAHKLTLTDTTNANELYSVDLPFEKYGYGDVEAFTEESLSNFQFTPDGKLLVLLFKGDLYFINSENGAVVHTIVDMPANNLVLSPDGKLIAFESYFSDIRLWGVQP